MLYRVLVNGEDILDYNDPTMVLLSPQLEPEIDVAGSFEFTVPPNHKQYDLFTAESIMLMTIEVYEDGILHWFGRPVELHLDFYKNKKVYCEGGLGFFNDSIIREAEYEETLLSVIFAAVINEHNSMVPENRRFTVGQFTVADHTVYRKFNYEQTSDVLKSKFLDAEEGHFFVRRENGVNYIDFLKDMPYTCNQEVEFAENLLNFTYSFDGKDFATCVIPLGAADEETRKPITIKSVNNNSDILVGNTASIYGNIVKVQNYSDLVDPNELMAEGRKYLTTLQYNAFLIECSAVDLHSKNSEKQLFRVGQTVRCVSNPHGINLELPISKMTLYLDSAAKQITLGRIPKKTLARFYKEHIGTGGVNPSDIDDTLPAGFDIITDPETGDPSLIKVPVSMQIMTLPYRDGSQANSSYEYGDTLIFDGLTAKLVAKGLSRDDPPDTPMTYFSDANYPTGDIPFNELSFEPTTYNQHTGKIMVWCIWTNPSGLYNGIKFRKPFYMHSLSEKALEDAQKAHHIVIENPPTKTEYYDGGFIQLAGAKVVAYTEGNQPYTKNGYTNGVIPLSELSVSPVRASLGSSDGSAKIGDANIPYTKSFNATQYVKNWGNWELYRNVSISIGGSAILVLLGTIYHAIAEEPFSCSVTSTYANGSTHTEIVNSHRVETNSIDGNMIYDAFPVSMADDGVNTRVEYHNAPAQASAGTTGLQTSHIAATLTNPSYEDYGISKEEGENITVSWPRPEDGVALTDSYRIKVTKQPSQGGR